MSDDNEVMSADVVLVGAGIMSTTLAVFLKELQPHLRIAMIERLPGEAQESSGAWNNAGTGHAANCELNYTPAGPDVLMYEASLTDPQGRQRRHRQGA